MKAIICGGGIGGLTAALCLNHFGIAPLVLERTAVLTEAGAGIQISPNAMRVFAAIGLDQAVAAAGFRPAAIQVRRGSDGAVLSTRHLPSSSDRPDFVNCHRSDLLAVLADALEQRRPGAIQTGRQVVTCDQNADSAAVTLSDGSQVEGDIVIGADGIRSIIREQLFGPENPIFTGNVAWRATVPVAELGRDRPLPVTSLWLGEGRHAVTYLLRGGTLANFVGVVECETWQSESWTERGDPDDLRRDFADWHSTIAALTKALQVPYRWALFDRNPMPQWSIGRIGLIGDACHPMLPFLAQGGAQAIEDSYVLARLLSENMAPEKAFAEFFAVRHPRTDRIQTEARANMRRFHRPQAIAAAAPLIPNPIRKRIAEPIWGSTLDWLYGHDVTV